jgi:hypothetical protein
MLISLLLFSSLAKAGDYAQLQQGQAAPFNGTLLKPEALATIISTNDAAVATCKAEGQHDVEKLQIEFDLEKEKCEQDYSTLKLTSEQIDAIKQKEIEDLRMIIQKQSKPNLPLWIALGFVGGLATSYGTIYVYEQITNE